VAIASKKKQLKIDEEESLFGGITRSSNEYDSEGSNHHMLANYNDKG
jgi:hypothetical protein